MNKDALIPRILDFAKTSNNIALQWATGLGKSRAALEIASIKKRSYEKTSFKILLIVAETAHKENWITEFKKWGKEDLLVNTTIECYHSLKNYVDTSFDLIILDEGHHSYSETRLSILETIKTTFLMVLSATLKPEHLTSLSSIFGPILYDTITLNTAIRKQYLPEPKFYLIPLHLEDIKGTFGIIEEWGDKKKRVFIQCEYADKWAYLTKKSLYPNVTLAISCTAKEKYEYYSKNAEYYKNLYYTTRQPFAKIKWLRAGLDRKLFLGEIKTSSVNTLIQNLKNKRFICFCTNIEQAEELGKNNCIHSKKKESLEIINSFNKKEINSLFVVGMLQEGQNLTDIEVGIIIQLDNEGRSFIQKSGRSMRAEDPKQYIFYFVGTRDEEFLNKNIIEGISPEYVYTINNLNKLNDN